MAEAGIDPRQRAFADFRQHSHVHRRFFVGRRVRRGIGMAAGQPIDRLLAGIHRHVKFLALHAIGHQRPNPHLAIARCQLHPAAAPESPRSAASSGETSTNVSGVFSRIPCTR